MWPPRIIAKESAEEKYEAPGLIVTRSNPNSTQLVVA